MTEERPFIDFNMNCILELKERYNDNVRFMEEHLKPLDTHSPKKMVNFFRDNLAISLDNVTISHLQDQAAKLDHDSQAFDYLNGLIQLLKLRYSLHNYIDCIIRHHENGRVYLRHERGEWVLPNKRPLSGSPEIKECYLRTHIPKGARNGSNFEF